MNLLAPASQAFDGANFDFLSWLAARAARLLYVSRGPTRLRIIDRLCISAFYVAPQSREPKDQSEESSRDATECF